MGLRSRDYVDSIHFPDNIAPPFTLMAAWSLTPWLTTMAYHLHAMGVEDASDAGQGRVSITERVRSGIGIGP